MKEILYQKCKILIFFGGTSNEVNISLDSTRTFYDSIRYQLVEKNIYIIFIDKKLNYYLIDKKWIYCNHIEDFKKKINPKKKIIFNSNLFKKLIKNCHAFFPFIHGKYGEDGVLTAFIQSYNRWSIMGSNPIVLKNTLNKYKTYEILKKNNFLTPLHWKITSKKNLEYQKKEINLFFSKKKIIIKPNDGGSSDGVVLTNLTNLEKDLKITQRISNIVLLEEYIQGREFSIVVIEDKKDNPFPLTPTEIKFKDNLQNIYTRTKKYLPGSGAFHLTPPSFRLEIIKKIVEQAKKIYKIFQFKDWVRLDGFINLKNQIIWNDFNGIPGFGQDSFIFQQCSLFNINTQDISLYLLKKVMAKENYSFIAKNKPNPFQKTIGIIGGGGTSEKQISRMSWLNVIEKLEYLNKYKLRYFFLDSQNNIWETNKFIVLKHTIDEIEKIIKNKKKYLFQFNAINKKKIFSRKIFTGCLNIKKINFNHFKKLDFLFIALHGGIGENGVIQKKLEKLNIPFNGSSGTVSQICSDKFKSNQLLRKMKLKGFVAPQQINFSSQDLWQYLNSNQITYKFSLDSLLKKKINLKKNHFYIFTKRFFSNLIKKKKSQWVIKPRSDGCSTGVIILNDTYYQLFIFFYFFFNRIEQIPFDLIYKKKKTEKFIQLPLFDPKINTDFLLEEYLDDKQNIELTVGVLEEMKKAKFKSLLPSKTIADNKVLSLDEKFNKGLGINLTPPIELASPDILSIQKKIEILAHRFDLKGYARIDIFYNLKKKTIYLIEINNLPSLTVATVIFTQSWLTPSINLNPSNFLDRIIKLGFKKKN